jgi:L-galactono-1,4-lactone dehydrogenase
MWHECISCVWITYGSLCNGRKWLLENKHLRYMWIPDTDTVVVVQCNPLTEGQVPKESMSHKYSEDERLSAARTLYREVAAKFL